MAKLTFSQKAEMAAKTTFQQRVWMAFKKQAKYWVELQSGISQLSDYNAATQKKIRYSKNILAQGSNFGSLRAISEYLLNIYDEENPVLDENLELADSVIADSFHSANTFENFAGVQLGDSSRLIEW